MMTSYTKYYEFINSCVGHIKRCPSSCFFATSLSCRGFPVLDNKSRECCRRCSCPSMISSFNKALTHDLRNALTLPHHGLELVFSSSNTKLFLDICGGKQQVTSGLRSQRAYYELWCLHDANLKKLPNKQSSGRLFDTLLRSQYWNVSTQLCSRDGYVIVTVREYIGLFSAK